MFGFLAVIALRECWRRCSADACSRARRRGAGERDRGARQLVAAAADRRRRASAQRGFDGWRASLPPMGFLGVYESATGGFLVDLPRRRDDRAARPARRSAGTALYDAAAAACSAIGAPRGCRLRRGVVLIGGPRVRAERAGTCRRWRVAAAVAAPAIARWRLAYETILARDRGGARGFRFRAGRDVAQQDASADPGVRRGGRLRAWRSSRSPMSTSQQAARPIGRGCWRFSRCCTAPAGRLSSYAPRAGGAARQLGLPARLAGHSGARSRPACRRAALLALVLPIAGVLLPLFAFVLGRRTRWRTPPLGSPAPSSCSKR